MDQNYKLLIAYDGTRYHGWEAKPDTELTIEGKLERVLERLADAPVKVIGAGRTDAGVHAQGMTANVHLHTSLSETEIRNYCNQYLPEDICVREVKLASERFHARYHAVGKTYCYTCYDGPLKPVFNRKFVYMLEKSPDVEAMRQAAALLVGRHDFRSFCGNPQMKKSTVRTITSIEISKNKAYLSFTYQGDGFLRYMVRILTGTLLEVGYGKRTPQSMTELLALKKRSAAGYLMPPQGLCLLKVHY